jgi:hypothetical protein
MVLVVLGGDAGGGLLAEPDVDAEGGQVPVARLACSSTALRPLAARWVSPEWRSWWRVYPAPCGSWSWDACLNRYSARG